MNKLVINHLEKIFVTSDTGTIVKELEVVHPAAKMVVMAATMQESEVRAASHAAGGPSRARGGLTPPARPKVWRRDQPGRIPRRRALEAGPGASSQGVIPRFLSPPRLAPLTACARASTPLRSFPATSARSRRRLRSSSVRAPWDTDSWPPRPRSPPPARQPSCPASWTRRTSRSATRWRSGPSSWPSSTGTTTCSPTRSPRLRPW